MFHKLQRKLTLTYSLWFFLTLTVLFVILFFIFKNMVYQSVLWQVEDIVHDQTSEFSERHHLEKGPFRHSLYLSAFLSSDGKDIVYKGTLPDHLRREFIVRIHDKKESGLIRTGSGRSEKVLLIYAAEPVKEKGRVSGYFLVAKGITQTHELIEQWFRVLFILGLTAALLSILVAHILARRAVLPVKHNYEKQRDFIANASHEMRTPLSVFSASLEYLEAEEKGRLSDSSKETLADLKEEVREMNMLISHLLDLARADRGGFAEDQSVFPIHEFIDSVIPYFQHKAFMEKKTFHLDLPKAEVVVRANPTEIRQLLTIFLDNAFKYTNVRDAITLTVQIKEEKQQYLCISIKDSGIGISESDQSHIYERFYRVEKGRARQSGGNGLGLSIAREIVDAYHGRIDVDSRINRGTVFHILLPILKNRG